MNEKIILIISSKLVENFIYRNQALITKFKREFSQIIIINLQKSNFKNKYPFLKIISVNDIFDLTHYLKKNKNYLYINFIKKNFKNLRIFFLLKLFKIQFIEVYCLGDIKDFKIYFNKSLINNIFKIYYLCTKSILLIIYNIFGAAGIIQRPLFLVHTFDNYYDQVLNAFDNLIKNRINIFLLGLLNIFKIRFYKKIYLIDKPLTTLNKKKVSSDYCVFIDSCFDHTDRKLYDRPASNLEKRLYYESLNNFFSKVKNIYNKKIIFLKHPDTILSSIKVNAKNVKIIINNTNNYILKAKLVMFHESSVVISALILKKKIINMQSANMGKYYAFRNAIYSRKLNITSINIDDDLSKFQIQNRLKNINPIHKKYFNNFNKNKRLLRYNIDQLIIIIKNKF